MTSIAYDSKSFLIDKKRILILSGAIHYFRVPNELWRDRIVKAKRAGLNTIETYIAWNFQELKEGRYDFKGDKDIDRFFSICKELGMYIIVRLGPYICSEWDGGGLPAWLNTKKGIELRTNNPVFLKYVDRWFDKLIPIIAKHQIIQGGKIILIQIENEYFYPLIDIISTTPYSRPGGKEYLEYLRDNLQNRGIKVPLITSNNFAYPIDRVIETRTGKGPYEEIIRKHKKKQAQAPYLQIEFHGPIHPDCWGKKRKIQTALILSRYAKEVIACGGNYNYYMFCGGTNFGFWGGSGVGNEFFTTSYDLDAPLTETGGLSGRYYFTKLVNWFGQTFSDFITNGEIIRDKIKTGRLNVKTIVQQKKKEKMVFFINDTLRRIKTSLTILGKKYPFSVPGQDVKIIPINYQLSPRIKIFFTDSCILYIEKIGCRTYILLHGKEKERGVFILRLEKKPEVIKGDNPFFSFTWDEKRKTFSLSFTYPSENKKIDVLIKSDIYLHIILTNEKVAQKSWIIKEKGIQILVLGPDFVGDIENKSTISVFTRPSKSIVIYSNKNPEGKGIIPQFEKELPILPVFSSWEACKDIPEIYPEITPSSWQKIPYPMAMERFGCNLGYCWYRMELKAKKGKKTNIFFSGALDRLKVFLNGNLIGTRGYLAGGLNPISGWLKEGKNILVVLVDNLGRQCSGIRLNNPKGLLNPVYLEATEIDLNRKWRFKLAKGQPAEKRLSVDNRWAIFGEQSNHRAKFTWVETNVDIKQGESASLYYTNVHLPHWIYINNELIWYATKDDQINGDGIYQIGKYLKPGGNTIRFCFENLEEMSIVNNIKLIVYPLEAQPSAKWFFRRGICEKEFPPPGTWKYWKGKDFNKKGFLCWWRTTFSFSKTWNPVKLRMDGMSKGQIYLNRHNIGRYWQIGPQKEYYLPEPCLKYKNELIIFDEEGKIPQKVRLIYDKDWENLIPQKLTGIN